MKSIIVFCVLSVTALTWARPDDHYTNKYDNVDIDEIITNNRTFDSYYKCIMDLGKCTPEGKELKGHIKDALETECEHCTEIQKKHCKKVIGHMINQKPDMWKELCAKYDPDNKYALKYEKELKEITA